MEPALHRVVATVAEAVNTGRLEAERAQRLLGAMLLDRFAPGNPAERGATTSFARPRAETPILTRLATSPW